MKFESASALLAKAKVAGLLGAALAAGGVGGTVALTHVAPASTTQVVTSADSSTDPESADAETPDAQTSDPETTDAQDPETPEAQDPAPADCPSDVKNHGAYVSSIAHSAPHGKGGVHGKAVSEAAKTNCGKDKSDATEGSDDPESSDAGSQDPESGDAQSGDALSGDAESGDEESGGGGHKSDGAKPSHKTSSKSKDGGHAHH